MAIAGLLSWRKVITWIQITLQLLIIKISPSNMFEMKDWRINGSHSVSSFPRQVNEIVRGLLASEFLIKNRLHTYSSHLRVRLGRREHILWELITQSMLLLTKGKPQIQCCQISAKTLGAVSHQMKWYSLFTASGAVEHLLWYCFIFFYIPPPCWKDKLIMCSVHTRTWNTPKSCL